MKSILKILVSILFLAITIVIASFFISKDQMVVQSQEINVSSVIVYEQISDFKNWKNWFPWLMKDSAMVINSADFSKEKGGQMSWESKKYNNCKLTITQSIKPENVAVNFDCNSDNKTTMLWYIEETKEGCILNWTVYLKDLNIFEKYFTLFNKNKLNELLIEGLQNIKRQSTKVKYSRLGEFSILDLVAQPSVIIIDSVQSELKQERVEKNNTQLLHFFERREMHPTGKAFRIDFGRINDTLQKFAVGYPIEERTWVWSTMKYYELPEGKAIKVSHFGRTDTQSGHACIKEYIKNNKYEVNGNAWEIYQFNPEIDSDTSLWEIEIYYPIK
jgi:effector-binding domain-containing protein